MGSPGRTVGNKFEDIKLIPQNTLLWGQLDVPSYRHHLYLLRNGALHIVRFDTIAANSIQFIHVHHFYSPELSIYGRASFWCMNGAEACETFAVLLMSSS